jgi:hypothetical protein
VSPMRARNGYRGLHEVISGTRTYHLRWPGPRKRVAVQRPSFQRELMRPKELPERVGPFLVQGALCWNDRDRTLMASDPQLDRTVCLWLRPVSEPPLDAASRDIGRSTRCRWVACGTDSAWQWDAFVAPAGMQLPALTAGASLSWGEVRPILEELAEELDASCTEGTLPNSLDADQVWVQPDGCVQLLVAKPSIGESHTIGEILAEPEALSEQERALQLLRDVAVTALEGGVRQIDETGDSVRAPLPAHASDLLDRLLGGPRQYRAIAPFRNDLQSVSDRPPAVSRLRRAAHVALLALFLTMPTCGIGPVMLVIFSIAPLLDHLDDPAQGVNAGRSFGTGLLVVGCCAFLMVWAFATRGGFAYWCAGIALRRRDGRKASRLQCAFRALLVWGPVTAFYCLAVTAAHYEPSWLWLGFGFWGLANLLLPLYIVVALILPTRSLHDHITGTYLMPA